MFRDSCLNSNTHPEQNARRKTQESAAWRTTVLLADAVIPSTVAISNGRATEGTTFPVTPAFLTDFLATAWTRLGLFGQPQRGQRKAGEADSELLQRRAARVMDWASPLASSSNLSFITFFSF